MKSVMELIISGDSKGAVAAIGKVDSALGKNQGISRQAAATQKTLNQHTQSLARGMGLLASAVGAVGFVGFAKGQLDAADRVQKLALRIGASTEAISEYNHVAELSGVRAESLGMAWQRQTRRISEAASGYGEAQKALAELGVDVQALNQMRPEEQFEALAQALQGVESEADRVRLAMKFWDSEGVSMLQIVNQGTDAMAAMRQEARDLGLTISQDMADMAAATNDSMTRLQAAATGAGRALVMELAPGLQSASSSILAFTQDSEKMEAVTTAAFIAAGVAAGRYALQAGLVVAAKANEIQASIQSAQAAKAEALAKVKAEGDQQIAIQQTAAAEASAHARKMAEVAREQVANVQQLKMVAQRMAAAESEAVQQRQFAAELKLYGAQRAAIEAQAAGAIKARQAAVAQLSAAEKELTASTIAATAAQARAAAATSAVGAASTAAAAKVSGLAATQAAASSAAGLLATAGRGLLGALGGIPGLILTVGGGLAAYALTANDATAATRNYREELANLRGDEGAANIERIKARMAELRTEIEAMRQEQKAGFFDVLTGNVKTLQPEINDATRLMNALSAELEQAKAQHDSAAQGANNQANALTTLTAATRDYSSVINTLRPGLADYQKKLIEIENAEIELGLSTKDVAKLQAEALKQYKAASGQLPKLAKAVKVTATETKELADETDRVADSVESAVQALQEEIIKMTQGEDAARRFRLTNQGWNETQIEKIELLHESIGALEKAAKAEKETEEAAEKAAENIRRSHEDAVQGATDSIMGFIDAARGGFDSLKDYMMNLFDNVVLRPIIQATMAGVMGGAPGMASAGGFDLGGIVSSLSGGSSGGGLSSLLNGDIFGDFGSSIIDIGATAVGTVAHSAISSIAGLGSQQAAMLAAQTAEFGLAGAAMTGQALGGAAGTAGSVMSTLGTIAPYAAIAAIAIPKLIDMFDDGETRAGGLYTLERGPDTAFAQQGFAKRQGPSGGDIGEIGAVQELMTATRSTTEALLKLTGSSASVWSFRAAMETSDKGRGGVYAGGLVELADGTMKEFGEYFKGDNVFESDTPRSLTGEEAVKAFELDLQQSTIQALQAATDKEQWADAILGGIDAESLGSDEIQQIFHDLEMFGQARQLIDDLSDGAAMYDELSSAHGTAWGQVQRHRDALIEEARVYDMSLEATQRLAAGLQNFTGLAMQMRAALDAAGDSIQGAIGGAMESIRMSVMDTEEQYDYLRAKAQSLAATIPTILDPAQLDATVAEITQLTNRAFGLQGDKEATADDTLGFLADVEQAALAQLEAAGAQLTADSVAIADTVTTAIDGSAAVAAQQAEIAAKEADTATQNAATADKMEATVNVMGAILANLGTVVETSAQVADQSSRSVAGLLSGLAEVN